MAIGVDTSSVREAAGPLTCLFASAVVVVIAISSNGLEKNSSRFGHLVYGLVLSCLTILLVGAMIKSTDSLLPLSQQYIVMAVFAILWVVAACFLTFSGPFLLTGNGTCSFVLCIMRYAAVGSASHSTMLLSILL